MLRVRMDDMSAVLDRLELTREQRRRADSIVARSAPRSEAIMLEVGERLQAVADTVDRELRAVLTAEQQTLLDSMRTGPRLVLKRKDSGSSGARVDTVVAPGTKRP